MGGNIRILGFVILVLGVVFVIWGMNEAGTFANRVVKEMAGTYPKETKWYIFGGIVMIVVGAGMVCRNFFGGKR